MEHVEGLLPDYLTGGLEAQERARVEGHLRGCPRCQKELRALEQAFYLVAEALPPTPPPPGTWARIKARARLVRGGRPQVRSFFLAAALAGVLLVGAHLWQRAARGEALLEQVAYWASDPGTHWRFLRSDGQSLGLLLWREDGRCLILMREPPPPGRRYQLWGEAEGRFHPLAQTGARVLEANYGRFRTLALSLEPPGKTEGPRTGPPEALLVRLQLP
ncbi:anti-sigma factor [Thermus sp. FJN-A]